MKQATFLIVLLFLTATAVRAAVPVVTNVVARQVPDTKTVEITYDLFDNDGDALKIRVEISDNGGNLYSVPAFSLVGDIGENIETGVNKRILWDAGADWDGEYSTQMVVKVFAIDNDGFPGLEWGNEIPPSGFLMGQDGGAEGSGPSRHVLIPWSYWLSKYEVRNDQYADFLNMALVAGDVVRIENEVQANNFRFAGVPGGSLLTILGDTQDIRWNVNNFEVVGGRTNHPVRTTWYGAMAFAQYYGYDLPTDAEWEKAARGPDHDDEDQHLRYPWGDTLNKWNANYALSEDPFEAWGTTPVGYYDGNQFPLGLDTVNPYGLYDVAGNVAEWSRSLLVGDVEVYPQVESISNLLNNIDATENRVLRGGNFDQNPVFPGEASALSIFYRESAPPASLVLAGLPIYLGKGTAGFRVVRRDLNYQDPKPAVEFFENFDNLSIWTSTSTGNWTINAPSGVWRGGQYTTRVINDRLARSGSGCIGFTNFNSQLYLPPINGKPGGISFYVREVATGGAFDSFVQLFERDGNSWKQFGDTFTIKGENYQQIDINVSQAQVKEFMIFAYRVYLDDVKVITIPN